MNENRTAQAREPAGAKARSRAALSNRILVVDDDIDLRLLSAEVLFRSGYQVDTAEDGETGWEALQARNYDLLITDNKMPKVSGVELVRKLRSARMALPVILATGAMPEELDRHPWLQLAATLLKPFTGEELLGTVKKVLRVTDSAREQIEPLRIWRSRPSADALRLI
jgi:two-component system, OmpR family, alkaline phosphatase synthesis response regulator PhoP